LSAGRSHPEPFRMGCCSSASNRSLPPEPKFHTNEPFLRFQEVVDADEIKAFEGVFAYNLVGLRAAKAQCPPDGAAGKHVGSQEGAQLALMHGTLEITQEGIDKLPPELRLGPWSKPGVYETVCRFNLFEKSFRVSMKFNYEFERGDKYSTSYSPESGYFGMDIHMSATYLEGDNTLTFADAYDVYQLEDFVKGNICKKLGYLCCKTNSTVRVLGLSAANRKRYDAVASVASAMDMPYNSKMASACGPAAVRYSLIPPRKPGPPGAPLPRGTLDHEASRKLLRDEVVEDKNNEWEFDFRMQLATAACCPGPIRAVEDPTLLWNETKSEPIVLGKLRIKTGVPDKSAFFALAPDAGAPTMKFSPWNSPHEHRPLGNVGRCRRYVYHRHADARIKEFGLAPVTCPFAAM